MKRKVSSPPKRTTRAAEHPPVEPLLELRNRIIEQLEGRQDFDPGELTPLWHAVAGCPAFAPGWLTLGRKSALSADPSPGFEEERGCLENAVITSAGTPEALTELGWFEHSLGEDSARAEPLFIEAIHRGEAILVASYSGLLSVLQEREDWGPVLELCDRLEQLFPHQVLLMKDVEVARQLAGGAKPKPKPKPKPTMPKSTKRPKPKAARR